MPPLSELTRILRELVSDPETQVIEQNPHWRQRMRKHGITLVDIASTLSRSAVTEDQGDGDYGDRCRIQVRDDNGKRTHSESLALQQGVATLLVLEGSHQATFKVAGFAWSVEKLVARSREVEKLTIRLTAKD